MASKSSIVVALPDRFQFTELLGILVPTIVVFRTESKPPPVPTAALQFEFIPSTFILNVVTDHKPKVCVADAE